MGRADFFSEIIVIAVSGIMRRTVAKLLLRCCLGEWLWWQCEDLKKTALRQKSRGMTD